MNDLTRRIADSLERLDYLKDTYVAERVAYEEWGSAGLEALLREAQAALKRHAVRERYYCTQLDAMTDSYDIGSYYDRDDWRRVRSDEATQEDYDTLYKELFEE